MENKDQIDSIKLAIRNGVRKALDGDTPRLIDEWQGVPEIWDAVRFEVDHRRKKGQFILTGSSAPPEGSVMHSGAGRIARVTMRTMSLFESGESNGQVSLKDLFNPDCEVDGYSDLKVDALARAIARGGWPESLANPATGRRGSHPSMSRP
ncbi:MAG: AAA family ATPase [Candidatus Methanoplasma sp.]|nr:AAA family ATPase [Candidatus Methanoplasma sp.]